MLLWYLTDGVFLTLLALALLILVAQLPHKCKAQCTPGALVDSLVTSASQPALDIPNPKLKLKVLGSLVTISRIDFYTSGSWPEEAKIYSDRNGPDVIIASATRTPVSQYHYQYLFNGVELGPGLYWLLFGSGLMQGWTWSDWSGEDNFHSLSFASDIYAGSNLVPTMLITGCGAILASTSPSPSTSPTTSATPSTSPTPSDTLSSSPTPTSPPSSSPLHPSTPLPSPSSSATPSAIPKLMSLTHATAEFDSSQAAFRLSGTFISSGSGSATSDQSSVRSQLSSVQIGNVTLLASDLNETTREVIPDPATTGNKPLTYVYTTLLLDYAIEIHQNFAFHERETKVSFAGVEFDIEANSVKWSFNFTSTNTTSSSSSSSSLSPSPLPSLSSSLPHSTQPTIVRYLLAGGDVLTTPAPAADGRIIRRANTPREGLTTYYLPLEGRALGSAQSVLATVLLFDLAVVDGVVSPVRHNITLVATAVGANVTYNYEVAVELPAFSQWMHYDPSVGMGRLLGADGRGGDGSGSNNTGLIVGVAVAVLVAVVAVLAAITAGVAFGWYKRRALRHSSTVNFDMHDGSDDQPDRL